MGKIFGNNLTTKEGLNDIKQIILDNIPANLEENFPFIPSGPAAELGY